MTQLVKFPKSFFWGTATSSHQVEGKNFNDWSKWEKENADRLALEAEKKWGAEQKKAFPEMLDPKNYLSEKAVSHYLRFEEDLDLAKYLNQNAYRFSIEWSLVEPEEGKFNEKEILHYKQLLLALEERKIEPFVTLWHFSLPLWLSEKGGTACREFPKYFEKFTSKIVFELGEKVKFWITINEPSIYVANAYLKGFWPPQRKNWWLAYKSYRNLLLSHNIAYKIIKEKNSSSQVGFANNIAFLESKLKFCLLNKLAIKIYYELVEKRVYIFTEGHNDFLGLNYYFHNLFKAPLKISNENKEVNDLGWEIFPQGIYEVLKRLKKYNLPVFITENGLADATDQKREKFIKNHLFWMKKAMEEGTLVRGYFHWSLLDNFEWDKGFWPRFGLVEVDRETGERRIRKSALFYSKIAKENQMEMED